MLAASVPATPGATPLTTLPPMLTVLPAATVRPPFAFNIPVTVCVPPTVSLPVMAALPPTVMLPVVATVVKVGVSEVAMVRVLAACVTTMLVPCATFTVAPGAMFTPPTPFAIRFQPLVAMAATLSTLVFNCVSAPPTVVWLPAPPTTPAALTGLIGWLKPLNVPVALLYVVPAPSALAAEVPRLLMSVAALLIAVVFEATFWLVAFNWLPFTASVLVALNVPGARFVILVLPMLMPALLSDGPLASAMLVRPVNTGLMPMATLVPLCVSMMLLPAVNVAVPPGATFATLVPLATPVPVAAVVTLKPFVAIAATLSTLVFNCVSAPPTVVWLTALPTTPAALTGLIGWVKPVMPVALL